MNGKKLFDGFVLNVAVILSTLSASAQDKVVCTFNPKNVVLPSSQYTPDVPYQADVWVCNTGRRYSEQFYNKVWAVPENDFEGHDWFDPAFDVDNVSQEWVTATAPFSSDDYYKGHKSFRWITSEIMGDIYVRRTFSLTEPLSGAVYMSVGHDDAPSEWYINGVLVHTVSDGWNNDEYVLLTDEQKALVKTDGSENVIAVHVHQNWGGAFADCGLYVADMSVESQLLHTVSDGPWNCKYYILNYNSDISDAENGKWASLEEDEADWVNGIGPFSNDDNMFFTTEWPSQVRPILIRRHFNLSASELETAKNGVIKLVCSYDENPKVYLNGVLIWSTSGWNDNNYTEMVLSERNKRLLQEGDNVLAVSLTQGGGGGHIDYGLKLVKDYIPTSVNHFKAVTDKEDNRIYNLNGQYLGTSADRLAKGIYIVGGKKKVIGI